MIWKKAEVVVQKCPVKMVFLEILQNLQENTCTRVSFLIKLAYNFIKKRPWQRRFSVNFAKFLGTPFYKDTSGGCFWKKAVSKNVAKLTRKH